MNNAFRTNCQVGNFKSEIKINRNDIKALVKRNNELYAITDKREYLLKPMDDMAELVIRNFSDYTGEQNESIYELEVNGEYLVVLLYVFKSVKRIQLKSETMHIYLDRLLKNEYLSNGKIANDDEVAFLNKEFLINKSVLIIEYQGGQATKTFQMFGNTYRADIEIERPGVYRIKKLVEYKVNNRVEQLTQIFGYIKFVTFDEAITISGRDSLKRDIKTNEIFKAWDEYLKFEETLFNEDVKELGFVKYNSFSINDEEVIFKLPEKANETKLFGKGDESLNREYDVVLGVSDCNFNTVEDIINYRNEHKENVISVGKILNNSLETDEIKFLYPEIAIQFTVKGFLLLSDKSIKVGNKRRKAIMKVIDSKANITSNMLMRLSAGEEDTQSGGNINPITSDVLIKMFGKPDFTISENFRDAMNIAINTPDIALIQGPPGTGKTTLINGIIQRLSSMGGKNYKILVSSEQHEALYNVVDKISSQSMPAFITSEKYSQQARFENQEKINDITEKYQNKLLGICDDILSESSFKNRYSQELSKIIYCIKKIEESNYNHKEIKKESELIRQSIFYLDCRNDVKDIIEKIEYKIKDKTNSENSEYATEIINKKLKAQRLDREVFFNDDGIQQLKELQRTLGIYGYKDLLIDEDLKLKLIYDRDESVFDDYVNYVLKVKNQIVPDIDEFELEITSLKELFDKLIEKIRYNSANRIKSVDDIIEAFKYRVYDIDNVKELIQKYTSVIGSTCAQAEKSIDIVELNSLKQYDYVIIDEAARANPLDIMIPVILGVKVIMVGDHMQLPHYIETQYVKKFKSEKEKLKNYNEELLTKSLFEVLYESLEKSWKEGKLKFRRHIQIQEQHRMNPIIGNFISREFYEKEVIDADGKKEIKGKIYNGPDTKNKINNYNVYNGKNVVFVNVPITSGMEEMYCNSHIRYPEAIKTIDILKNIIRNNQNKEMKIGIISFYKAQVALLNQMLKENFANETLKQIECNTVDSYQGKEFDIVILSTTRSNNESGSGSLGFIYYAKSRINVALSRAKALLIVVGDERTLTKSSVFADYIDYTKKNGIYEE